MNDSLENVKRLRSQGLHTQAYAMMDRMMTCHEHRPWGSVPTCEECHRLKARAKVHMPTAALPNGKKRGAA